MKNFTYYAPTKVFFGRGAADNAGKFIKDFGAKKVLIHYGGKSALKSGLIPRLRENLTAAGLDFVELGGVEANPRVQLVREAVELCRREGVDFILAVGGGSAIDSSKSTALAVANNADPWDIICRKADVTASLPVASVLTIAAAGSEMSNSHVLSDLTIPAKRGLNTDLCRPVAAFMDPELTFTVPPYQTACGTVDMMMHTMERYYNSVCDARLTDDMSEALLLRVREAGAVAMEKPDDYAARAELMWASSLSHNGLMACGKDYKLLVVHQLAHPLSATRDDIAHGHTLAILYPAWARFVYKHDLYHFCRTAVKVWGVEDSGDDDATALAGIDAMENYFRSLGLKTRLHEVGINAEDLPAFADVVSAGGRVLDSYIPLGREEILKIFRLAL